MRRMKKKNCFGLILALALTLLFAVPCFAEGEVTSPAPGDEDVSPAPEETGRLVEEDGFWHYYNENGEMLKSTWQTVDGVQYYFKSNGNAATLSTKISGKYYIFDEDGKLQASDATKVVLIAGKYYRANKKGVAAPGWSDKSGKTVKASSSKMMFYFDKKGQALTGLQVIEVDYQGKFYQFKANGKINSSKTKKLQKLAKYEKDFAPLKKLLGEPQKSKYRVGCYKPNGKDGTLTYKNFKVLTFRYNTGKEIYMGVEPK